MRSREVATILLTCLGTVSKALLVTRAFHEVIPDQYIVRLKKQCSPAKHFNDVGIDWGDFVRKEGFKFLSSDERLYTFTNAYKPATLNNILNQNDCVRSVHPDQPTINISYPAPTPREPIEHENDPIAEPRTRYASQRRTEEKNQKRAPWHLRMLIVNGKQPIAIQSGLRGIFSSKFSYPYFAQAGSTVNIYHFGFFESLRSFKSRLGDIGHDNLERFFAFLPPNGDAGRGRFTGGSSTRRAIAAAGLSNSKYYGVAKEAKINTIRVNSAAGILAGLYKIEKEHALRCRMTVFGGQRHNRNAVVVLNHAVQDPFLIHEIERAIKRLDDIGVLVVVPAGDREMNVGRPPPASDLIAVLSEMPPFGIMTEAETLAYPCKFANALCVGGVNRAYTRYPLSNYGRAVNIWAPGLDVETSYSLVLTGTDLAASQVAGIAAIILSFQTGEDGPPTCHTFSMRNILADNGKIDYVRGIDATTRNLLANTGIRSTTDPFKPYIEGRAIVNIRAEDDQQIIDQAANDFYLEAPGTVRCSTSDEDQASWQDAEKLLLRLMWERGHSVSYDDDDADFHGRMKLVPCIETACVFLHAEGSHVLIRDASILIQGLLRIITECKVKKAIDVGGTIEFLHGKPMTPIRYGDPPYVQKKLKLILERAK